jgi:iron complex transport system ATP-binding protein
MMISTQLETRELGVMVAGQSLLSNLNWQVKQGEFWLILGKNGVGKSSLMRTLAGMRKPQQGQILCNQRLLNELSLQELAQSRAYLSQARNDAFSYTVLEIVLSARHPYQDAHYWETSDDLALLKHVLEQMDVAHLSGRDVRSLSGGERQRVAIATCLAQQTPLLLLDEPNNSLDLAHQVSSMRVFSQLCSEQQRAVVMVSHDLNLSYRVATHVLLMMGDGRYLIGKKEEMMTCAHLSACLGHEILSFQHEEQVFFVAKE